MARRSLNAKHLLYDASTRRFLARTGEWTRDMAQAIVFRDLASVVQFCLRHGFKDAEAVYSRLVLRARRDASWAVVM